jgi:hypothetical protein
MDSDDIQVRLIPHRINAMRRATRIFHQARLRRNASTTQQNVPFLLVDDSANNIELKLEKAVEKLVKYTRLRDEGKEEVELLQQAVKLGNATTKTKSNCSVCFDELVESDIALLPACCHFFHFACLITWLDSRSTCPMCRSDAHKEEMRMITAEQANILEAMSTNEIKKIVQLFL